jgi:hypothetical protein
MFNVQDKEISVPPRSSKKSLALPGLKIEQIQKQEDT